MTTCDTRYWILRRPSPAWGDNRWARNWIVVQTTDDPFVTLTYGDSAWEVIDREADPLPPFEPVVVA